MKPKKAGERIAKDQPRIAAMGDVDELNSTIGVLLGSIAAMNLLRLSQITGSKELRERAEKTIAAAANQLDQLPSAMAQMLCAVDFSMAKPRQIVIAGKPAGILGLLSPADTRKVTVGGHQGGVVVAELDLALLQQAAQLHLALLQLLPFSFSQEPRPFHYHILLPCPLCAP